ncbi:hypothetical protein [Aquisediminimonas profunda]|uniref:hypothetical protein n=1 Tax=Aquisediminimonas profunda TaxID=1550733 RepID=UPI001C63271E|nr:hypothetical protein [Aquisediminimonas profunda]
MDLSFARRRRDQKTGLKASTNLARLLADMSARQAVSPTALAQLRAKLAEDPAKEEHPEIAQFVLGGGRDAAAPKVGSFNAEIADTIVTQSKSL